MPRQHMNGVFNRDSFEDLAAGIPDPPWPPVYPKMPNEAPRVQPSRARKPE